MEPSSPDTTKRFAFAWAIVAALAFVWFVVSGVFPAVGAMLIVLHSIFFLGDVGMNGWRDAEFAPFNLGGLICALAGVLASGG